MAVKGKVQLAHRKRSEVQDRRWKGNLKLSPRKNRHGKKIHRKMEIVLTIQRILLVSQILVSFRAIHPKTGSISKFVSTDRIVPHVRTQLYFYGQGFHTMKFIVCPLPALFDRSLIFKILANKSFLRFEAIVIQFVPYKFYTALVYTDLL